ncbi:MAG: sensor histidine kinase, partial [Butyricicoccus sp.]
KGIRLRATEYQLLEEQINPHFIFNVLETVNMRCLAAGHREISRIVTDLAELLRAGVRSRNRQKLTFADELRYVQYYLDLQKARFQNALEYEIDYEDDSILSYYLPKLTIQPLVENAVVHGLEPRQGGGRVSVKLWEEDESIYVRIEDNGVGFDPQKEPEPATMGSKHTHIALPNIRERLQLLYGDAAQLRISSVPNQGTVALLIIPIDEKEA